MTQEVQPLTWSKRTNIEEHQQFFSKINEIIGNLAPTVDEAEQAIAQATAAIASANDAVATANAASAAASAAASQAQTAASTVAGYDGRLTAAEGDIDALQAADQTMTGNISALGSRMTAAESKNTQQDSAIAELQTADGQNVKINRINDYAVGLTGNQTVQAAKNFAGELIASGVWNNKAAANVENVSTWRRVYYNIAAGTSNQMLALFMAPQKPQQNSNEYGILIVGNSCAKWVVKGNGVIVDNFVVVVNAENQLELWVKNFNANRGLTFVRLSETNWGNAVNNWRADNATVNADFDPTTYSSYTVSS